MSDDGGRLRVVVVDDEDDVRFMLRLGLQTDDTEIVGEASDGMEALSVVEATQPDAIVLDLLMPRMNGFETIPELRRRYPALGIVAYTAVAGEFVRKEMERLGIPVVIKQSNPGPLLAALRTATARA